MLTFTHTYLINLAYQNLHHRNIPLIHGKLVLGNVIPDFVTHLGRDKFQARAHDLSALINLPLRTSLEWGAIFHILCDNYTTLGRLSFTGNYHDLARDGFIEKLAQQVILDIPLNIPKRRILQCAFDILVLQQERELLTALLRAANLFLQKNITFILQRFSSIYHIDESQLKVGLSRFSHVYGVNFIEQAALERYRLFPLIRSLLNLHSLTDPRIILKEIDSHSELMKMVKFNMRLIKDDWRELLQLTVEQVLKFPGMSKAILQII